MEESGGKSARKRENLAPSPFTRDVSPSPSTASKVSTISRISARFGALKTKDKKTTAEAEAKASKQKSPKNGNKKKNKKRSGEPSVAVVGDERSSAAAAAAADTAPPPPLPVVVVAPPDSCPAVVGRAKDKATTLERTNNSADVVRPKSPSGRPWGRLNRQKLLPLGKLIGKRTADSKAVAVQSTDLDMRTAVTGAAETDDRRLERETDGRAVATEAAVDCWSTRATNQKVIRRMQSPMEYYDSDESDDRLGRDNGANDPGPSSTVVTGTGDESRRAPLALQESSAATTPTAESELEDGATAPAQNGSLLHIAKKSPSEIRQEILSRTAPRPRRISDIVSPTFHPKSDNFQRQMSSQQQAKNGTLDNKKELLCKILVIGELGTGKTSIIKRYVHQFFSQHYRATIGVDFALKVLAWDTDTTIRLQLWDIAGQERFGNMTRVYYKEAHGAFIVFDVTRLATFEAVVKWKQDLDTKVQLSDGSPVPCVLLANKCDQPKEGIVNNHSKMDEYCKENNFVSWFETSAKDNINIDQAANCLVTKILQNEERKEAKDGNSSGAGVFPLDNNLDEKKKSCAC